MPASLSGNKADFRSLECRFPTGAVALLADVDPPCEHETFREQPRALQVRAHVPVEIERLGRKIENAFEAREAASADAVLISREIASRAPVLVDQDSGIR